jgi:hypothetical protein
MHVPKELLWALSLVYAPYLVALGLKIESDDRIQAQSKRGHVPPFV